MSSRALITGLLCALISATLVLPAIAEDRKETAGKDAKEPRPSAFLDVASEQMRLIMDGTVGKGVLHFDGKEYPFTFKSASNGFGAKGVKKINATGMVYFLNRIEDFAGQYAHISISQTIMPGATTTTAIYKNDKGVSINLQGTVEGMGLSLGGAIATVEIVNR